MLDGAATWDVCEFVAQEEKNPESPWFMQSGEQPRGYAAVMKVLRQAKAVIAAEGIGDREQLLQLHIAKRQAVYAKALEQGDMRAALACLDSEAKILGLFPKEQARTGKARAVVNHFNLTIVESPKEPLPVAEVVDETRGTFARLEVAPEAIGVHES
ncbi:MAG: hypothetical protein K2X38_21910 [Gemmataceae bacterium]|nr:hypothetical protein [Gemmataceae bacterium]